MHDSDLTKALESKRKVTAHLGDLFGGCRAFGQIFAQRSEHFHKNNHVKTVKLSYDHVIIETDNIGVCPKAHHFFHIAAKFTFKSGEILLSRTVFSGLHNTVKIVFRPGKTNGFQAGKFRSVVTFTVNTIKNAASSLGKLFIHIPRAEKRFKIPKLFYVHNLHSNQIGILIHYMIP